MMFRSLVSQLTANASRPPVRCGLLAFALLVGVTAINSAKAKDARPNFIIMIADDMAVEDCSPMGHPHIRTPNLQQLANEGLTFTQAFLTCSSCSPSRCSILTSRYPHQTNAEQLHQPLPADQLTFVEVLRKSGYYTASSGKWHLGPDARRAFDFIEEASTAGFQLATGKDGDSNPAMTDTANASGCAGWVKTLEACPNDKPFFLWLAAVDPHRDYQKGILKEPHTREDVIIPPYLPDTPEVRDDFALYYDEITRLDTYVGEVLRALEKRGDAENTVVIFMSDNGRPFPRCKTTVLDSGIQTPLIIRHPNRIDANARTSALVSSIDIGTTLLHLADLDIPEVMEGQSFHKVLEDPKQPHREEVYAEHNWHDFDAYQRAVRTSRYKYIRNLDRELTLSPPADAVRSPTFIAMRTLRDAGKLNDDQLQCFSAPRAPEELYDLQNDPHELTNLAGLSEHATTLAELRERLDRWRAATYDSAHTWRSADEFDRETGDPLPNRKRPRQAKTDGFIPMFNGKDLTGWKPISTPASTWTYDGELLVCSGKPIGELRTERMYQNFVLELEWRHMVPSGNAGVFVWADDITSRGVPFHRGVEVQILDHGYGNTRSYTTHGDIFPIHGAKMTPINGRGGSRAFPMESRANPSPQWNHYQIVCNQGEVSLAVNGKFVTQGRLASPQKGYICIESEGGVVHYRNVRIKELPDTPIESEADIAIADRGYRCLYLGLDLAGWIPQSEGIWKSNDWVLSRVASKDSDSQNSNESTNGTRLTSEETFGPSQWIVDVKRTEASGEIQFHLGETTTLRSTDPDIAAILGPVGQWDRWEISFKGRLISVKIGEKSVTRELENDGNLPIQLAIETAGPTDFANIYVRPTP